MAYVSPKSIELLEKQEVLSERELNARLDIRLETFTKKIQIESRVLGDLAINHIIPTVIKYQNRLIENVKGLKDILPANEFGDAASHQLNAIKRISRHKALIQEMVIEMVKARKKANKIEDVREQSNAYSKIVKPYLGDIRYHVDKLELIVDDALWPLPKYRELLYAK